MQEFEIPKIIGGVLIAILSFITFSKSIKGILKINTLLIPFIIFLILFLGTKRIDTFKIINTNKSLYWIISSILYASYNSITLIPIIISLKKYIKTKKDAKLIFIFTFIIMLALSLIIFFLINKLNNNIEIPIVYIASKLGYVWKYVYSICILIAIFTTAIASGYSFLNNVTSSKKTYYIFGIIICIGSIFFSQVGFTRLISVLYPVFGYLGIVQIFLLLIA